MNNFKFDRREFLEFFFTVAVTEFLYPHKLLGFIKPHLSKKGDNLQGIYGISLDNYPELIPIWGSIRIKIENTLMFYPQVIIVHVPKEEYGVEFIAVCERCPHEGYPVKDLDPDLHLFECSGHGTLFDVTGRYVWGPASRDLERLNLEYDGDKTIYLEVALYPLKKLDVEIETAFLHQNIPNPCYDKTKIVFGTMTPANVDILLLDFKGNVIQKIFYGLCTDKCAEIFIDVSNLESGTYFLTMKVDGKHLATKKLLVVH